MSNNDPFNVDILVNGNKCKQYTHDNRKYIESKNGSEWYLKIKNNTSGRILAVCSVDGLNVITGQKASHQDTGYIIGGYISQKIKGFRISDNDWARFKFGYKSNGNTYAQSKNDGSEKNCGVIGIKLFYEKIINNITIQTYPGAKWITGSDNLPYIKSTNPWSEPKWTYTCSGNSYTCSWGNSSLGNLRGIKIKRCNDSPDLTYDCSTFLSDTTKGFDTGTEFGRKEQSKIKNVEFERGLEAYSTDIYYASRQSLIDMGIPLTNEYTINLPQSFPNQYCKLPMNWKG